MLNPKRVGKKKKQPEAEQEDMAKIVEMHERHYTDKLYDLLVTGYDFRYNVMTKKPELRPKGNGEFEAIDERNKRTLKVFSRRRGFRIDKKDVGMEDISDIVESSFFLPEIHPLREYLEGLKWDGKNNIKALASCLALDASPDLLVNGKTQAEIFPILLRRFFINSCAILMNRDGAGTGHVMPILEGGQQKGKTTFINYLMPPHLKKEYGYAGHITPKMTDTTSSNMLVERWLVHIDDQLHTFTPQEAEVAKGFITADNVPDRKRFQISTKNEQRTASFLASVNGREIFTDSENRRYMVFCLNNSLEFSLDKEALYKIDINQVWAQAYSLLKKGESYLYTTEERLMIKLKNLQFKKISAEEEAIQACFEPSPPNVDGAVWHQASELLSIVSKVTRFNFNIHQFSKALKGLGFEPVSKKSKEYNNQARRCYCVKYRFREFGTNYILNQIDDEPDNN